jgi:hypothetical protein
LSALDAAGPKAEASGLTGSRGFWKCRTYFQIATRTAIHGKTGPERRPACSAAALLTTVRVGKIESSHGDHETACRLLRYAGFYQQSPGVFVCWECGARADSRGEVQSAYLLGEASSAVLVWLTCLQPATAHLLRDSALVRSQLCHMPRCRRLRQRPLFPMRHPRHHPRPRAHHMRCTRRLPAWLSRPPKPNLCWRPQTSSNVIGRSEAKSAERSRVIYGRHGVFEAPVGMAGRQHDYCRLWCGVRVGREGAKGTLKLTRMSVRDRRAAAYAATSARRPANSDQ